MIRHRGALRVDRACRLLLSAAVLAPSAHAQAPAAPTIPERAAPVELKHLQANDVDVTIDGRLDESVWRGLFPFDKFSTVEPDTLVPGRYPTIMRLFYTDLGLYVGMEMRQPAGTLVSRLSSRDQRNLNRDAVFITLDSSSEGRYGYWFGIGLGGSLMDGTILPERRYAQDWDGPWRGATAVTGEGWSAEMFLPWSMMSMPQADGTRTMGTYVSRKVAYVNERWAWPPLPETQPKFMSVLDRLQVENIAPRQQYSFYPYASVTADEIESDTFYKAGVDVFWRPSTNFQLTATLNPDFGTIEADDVIVNLTAIETFFPEKRLFFLEGKDVFVAAPRANPTPGPNATPTTLLNTRRIGGRAFRPDIPLGVVVPATELGQPAELLGAVKATGEGGGFRYGALAAMEDETRFDGIDAAGKPVPLDQEGRDFAVARIIYENSSGGPYRGIGWMSTLASHADRVAAVHAIDTHYLTRDGRWQWDNQLMLSDIDVEGQGFGGFIDARYSPKQGRNHIVALDYYDKKININDLGFFRRNNLIGTRYVYNQRTSNISFGRDAYFQVLIPHEWNTEWQVVRSGIFTEGFVIRDNLSELRFNLNWFPGRFEDLNSFGNGTYRIEERTHFLLGFTTDTSRPITAAIDARYEGEELGGYFTALQGALIWRPLDRLTSDLTLYHRDRNGWLLHQGGREMTTFDAEEWNVRFNLDFFFTARQHFRAALQWVGIKAFEDDFFQIPAKPGALIPVVKAPGEPTDNFRISTVNFQLRYRWEIAPMSDLFIVYTKNGNQRGLPYGGFRELFSDVFDSPVSEQLVVKLRYRFGS